MPTTVDIGSVKFEEAISFFKGKLNLPTQYWDDLNAEVHAKAFTVAGATKNDLLMDLRNTVDQAISDGMSIGQFRKQFDGLVAKHGWNYKGKRGWRTRVIYDTNMRSAHMAGRWQQIQRVKETRPYMQYQTVGDARVRPEHEAWDGLVLAIDDDFWITFYPPNGWGCRCTARTLSPRQMRREKLELSQAPAINYQRRINRKTGEDYGLVPQGIDTGFDYNVGKAWLGPDTALGEQVMRMPEALRNQALNEAQTLSPKLSRAFSPWVNQLLDRKQPQGEIKTVGYLKPSIVSALVERDQAPKTALITVTDKEIMHLLRDSKDGRHIPKDLVRAMPDAINNPKSILWDKRDPAVLYVFDAPGEDRKGKLVIRVNYKMKGKAADGTRHTIRTNSLRTGGLVSISNLKDKAFYDVLEGEL
ncbi:MAG TPA: phage minor head protein [Gammaproteobacteria bacterium]